MWSLARIIDTKGYVKYPTMTQEPYNMGSRTTDADDAEVACAPRTVRLRGRAFPNRRGGKQTRHTGTD